MHKYIFWILLLPSTSLIAEPCCYDDVDAQMRDTDAPTTTPFQNWDDRFKRWSRGKGGWDNWRDWRKPWKDGPWATADDFSTDMIADVVGDMETDMEFNLWLKVNMDFDIWNRMSDRARVDTYEYWQDEIRYDGRYDDTYHYYYDD
jgi:hypothetical protein